MKLSERLKKLRLEAGYTQKELALKLNKPYQVYQTWENGKRNPKKDNLENLANVFNVSVSYLLGETDVRSPSKIIYFMNQLSKERQDKVLAYSQILLAEQKKELSNIINLEQAREVISVEVIAINKLSAGHGLSYTDEIETTIVKTCETLPNYDKAVFIEGDSMEPQFHNGDVALIKLQPSLDYEGQVVAIDYDEKAYIKSVSIEDNRLRLESFNNELLANGERKYPDFFAYEEEQPRIIGTIVGSFTPLDV